eukprot:5532259-Prymnesium_polylepis.2
MDAERGGLVDEERHLGTKLLPIGRQPHASKTRQLDRRGEAAHIRLVDQCGRRTSVGRAEATLFGRRELAAALGRRNQLQLCPPILAGCCGVLRHVLDASEVAEAADVVAATRESAAIQSQVYRLAGGHRRREGGAQLWRRVDREDAAAVAERQRRLVAQSLIGELLAVESHLYRVERWRNGERARDAPDASDRVEVRAVEQLRPDAALVH